MADALVTGQIFLVRCEENGLLLKRFNNGSYATANPSEADHFQIEELAEDAAAEASHDIEKEFYAEPWVIISEQQFNELTDELNRLRKEASNG